MDFLSHGKFQFSETWFPPESGSKVETAKFFTPQMYQNILFDFICAFSFDLITLTLVRTLQNEKVKRKHFTLIEMICIDNFLSQTWRNLIRSQEMVQCGQISIF